MASMCSETNYADKRRRPQKFEEGEHVFLHVIPTTEVCRDYPFQ